MRQVWAFYGLTLALSWGYWGTLLALGLRVQPGSGATHLPGLAGPMVAALIVTGWTGGRPALGAFLTRFWRWPQRPWALAAALLLPVAATTATLAWQGALPPLADILAYPGLWQALPLWAGPLVVLVLNGFGEEAGWRGFLAPALISRLGRVGGTLAVCGFWALWHLPLFWLSASMAALVGPVLAGWLIGLTLGGFVLQWVCQMTGGSILAAALWHVAYNYSVATLATEGLPAAVTSTLVMVWGGVIALGWWWATVSRPDNRPRRG